ncbi:MAG: CPBP family glutamic-type intramembrane protease [Nitrososphaeraceae archaeon]
MLDHFKYDLNPLRWLSKFRRTSIPYLLLMFGFYHSLGLMVAFAGTMLIQTTIPGYVEPIIPRYLDSVVLAGPIEESLFFGIPLYGLANGNAALVGGLVWTFLHLINTEDLSISSLAYVNWLFVIPSFFFSFRVWITGKGWFAVVSHSVWNCFFFLAGCYAGEYKCMSYENPSALLSSTFLATLLVLITYWLYQKRRYLVEKKI